MINPKYFLIEVDGPVIIWKYNNPPKNLLTLESSAEFAALLDEFEADPVLRAGIFTSALPNVFIQHFDVATLVMMSDAIRQSPDAMPPGAPRPAYRPGSKVLIAAINNFLSGGGLELAQSFDFRFMSRDAYARQSEVLVGILAGGGGTQRMPRLIGIDKALELQLTARRIYADEAEKIGLITRACDPDDLMPEAIALAKAIAARPPRAVSLIRQAIYEGINLTLADGLSLEARLFQEVLKTEDANQLMKEYVALGQDVVEYLKTHQV